MSTPNPSPGPVHQGAITSTPPPPAPPPPAPGTGTTSAHEIRIISHSGLFYWWPVWAMGFLMALLTFIDGHRLILVPSDSKAQRDIPVAKPSGEKGELKTVPSEGVLLKSGHLLPDKPDKPGGELPDPDSPRLHMAANS